MANVICKMLGIQYPIFQGAMGSVGKRKIAGPLLVSAVSNAGGLGILPTWGRSSEDLRQEIRKTRELTDKPFAVNIVPLGREFFTNRAHVVIEEGISIVTTGRGDPEAKNVQELKSKGITVIPVVPTVALAKRLEREGADAVIASGAEAGGHVGEVATMPLIPQVVDAVKLPVIAAGGIGDARGIAASLALGACGVQLGTLFLATKEVGLSPLSHQVLIKSGDEDTAVTRALTGKPVRVVTGPEGKKLIRNEKTASEDELKHIYAEVSKLAKTESKGQIIPGGQVTGLIHDVLSTKELIHKLVLETGELLRRLSSQAQDWEEKGV
ncbi:MAG: nitronate monooxygenase [Desulfatiglans sp.]|nr:nitronate monooxygenase [Desulfatiglans sp.]